MNLALLKGSLIVTLVSDFGSTSIAADDELLGRIIVSSQPSNHTAMVVNISAFKDHFRIEVTRYTNVSLESPVDLAYALEIETGESSLKRFSERVRSLLLLPTSDKTSGLDGTSYRIEISGEGKRKILNFWSPNLNTEARGLEEVVDLITWISETTGIEPRPVFE